MIKYIRQFNKNMMFNALVAVIILAIVFLLEYFGII